MEPAVTLAGAAYLEKHNLRAMVKELLEGLAVEMPEDPIASLIEMLQARQEGKEFYLKCDNPWCEQRIRSIDMDQHRKACKADRWTKCIRCDNRVEVSKLHQHRMHCHLVACPQCGEFVFPRMLTLCPVAVLRIAQRRKFSGELLSREGSAVGLVSSSSTASLVRVASSILNNNSLHRSSSSARNTTALGALQALWRKRRIRSTFHDLAFQVIWNMMEFTRETKVAQRATTKSIMDGSCDNASPVLAPNMNRKTSIDSIFNTSTLPLEVERISKEYTEVFRADVFRIVEKREVVEFPVALKIIGDASKLLSHRSVVTYMESPVEGEVVVVGDLHGQIKDLLHIMTTQGMPSASKYFIFNGDFVDRGPNGIEVLLYIYVLLCSFPQYVWLNRGNHEDFKTNSEYGFVEELQSKYDDFGQEIMDAVVKSYKAMPLVTVIDKRVVVLHGGLPRHTVTLDRIAMIGKVKDIPTVEQTDEDEEMLCDILWSDPVECYKSRRLGARHQGEYWRTSARGCGVEYLDPHTEAFLSLNSLEMVVRSHEMVAGGYEVCHSGRCATVFSASDYCGVSGNRAAIALFSRLGGDPVYHTWFIKEDVNEDLELEASYFSSRDDADTLISFDEESILRGADGGDGGSSSVGGVGAVMISSGVQQDSVQRIRELVYLKRYDLMSHFGTVDAEQTGFVSKVEWCEVVRKVLEQPDLPWYYLCPFVADSVLFREIPSIRYAEFLSSIDSHCGRRFEDGWIAVTVKSVFGHMELPNDLAPATKEHERLAQRRMSSIAESAASFIGKPHAGSGSVAANGKTTGQSFVRHHPQPPEDTKAASSSPRARISMVHISDTTETPADEDHNNNSNHVKNRSSAKPSFHGLAGVTRCDSGLSDKDSLEGSTREFKPKVEVPEGKEEWKSFRFNFNYFVSVIRARSPTAAQLEDSDLYVLFRYCDADKDGHLVLGELMDLVSAVCGMMDDDDEDGSSSSSECYEDSNANATSAAQITVGALRGADEAVTCAANDSFHITKGGLSADKGSKERWMFPTVLMLQRFFLFDRHRDLRLMFRYMDRDRDGVVNFLDFQHAVKKMNRIVSKPVEESQMQLLFDDIRGSNEAGISVVQFVEYFSVRSFASYGSVAAAAAAASNERSVISLNESKLGEDVMSFTALSASRSPVPKRESVTQGSAAEHSGDTDLLEVLSEGGDLVGNRSKPSSPEPKPQR